MLACFVPLKVFGCLRHKSPFYSCLAPTYIRGHIGTGRARSKSCSPGDSGTLGRSWDLRGKWPKSATRETEPWAPWHSAWFSPKSWDEVLEPLSLNEPPAGTVRISIMSIGCNGLGSRCPRSRSKHSRCLQPACQNIIPPFQWVGSSESG